MIHNHKSRNICYIWPAVIAGAFSAYQASRANKFSERMSSTAHQREVKDLRAAGLNPILSAGGKGASSPIGQQAATPDVSSATTAAASKANLQAQTAKTISETNPVEYWKGIARSLGLPLDSFVEKYGIDLTKFQDQQGGTTAADPGHLLSTVHRNASEAARYRKRYGFTKKFGKYNAPKRKRPGHGSHRKKSRTKTNPYIWDIQKEHEPQYWSESP